MTCMKKKKGRFWFDLKTLYIMIKTVQEVNTLTTLYHIEACHTHDLEIL